MVAAGGKELVAVVIVADREHFTPCGGCMDWIMQFGSEKTVIAFQSRKVGPLHRYTAKELMPHYPR
jgi:cytidine deaminase